MTGYLRAFLAIYVCLWMPTLMYAIHVNIAHTKYEFVMLLNLCSLSTATDILISSDLLFFCLAHKIKMTSVHYCLYHFCGSHVCQI